MPTIGTFIQLLPKGFAGQPYRSTDGTVFVCVEGEGETRVGDTVLRWEPRDIFVVPSWMPHTHHADERGRAVQLFRPAGAGKARPVARGARQRVSAASGGKRFPVEPRKPGKASIVGDHGTSVLDGKRGKPRIGDIRPANAGFEA